MKEFAFRSFAVPNNTKEHLEDTFGGIQDATRDSKNDVMSKWNAYYNIVKYPGVKNETCLSCRCARGLAS